MMEIIALLIAGLTIWIVWNNLIRQTETKV